VFRTQLFAGFTTFFFLLELGALVYTFRLSFFVHVGNLLDIFIVTVCLFNEIGQNRGNVRLLGSVRFFWRLVRLLSTEEARKVRELESQLEGWHTDTQRLVEANLKISRLEDSVRREVESKKRVESLLRSYKDEVTFCLRKSERN
jgi:hypothetical protein